jgi:hypothetical protein
MISVVAMATHQVIISIVFIIIVIIIIIIINVNVRVSLRAHRLISRVLKLTIM